MYHGTQAELVRNALSVAILKGDGSDVHARLPLWERTADKQVFVAGEAGDQFAIQVYNPSVYDILVVPAIDHRAVLEDAVASPDGTGFILRRGARYVFDGWRADDDTTYPFIFTASPDSVSVQAAANLADAITGVIGFAVWRQRQNLHTMHMTRGLTVNSVNPTYDVHASVAVAGLESDLGTGIGAQEQHSPVTRAEFERAPGSVQIAKILYGSAENLAARGVLVPRDPEAFPKVRAFTGYRPA